MNLNINDDKHVQDPKNSDIRDGLESLEGDEFMILASEDEFYIQVYFHEDGAYQLEHRHGDVDQHYGTDIDSMTKDQVIEAFELFRTGSDDLHTRWTWERLEFEEEDFIDE